MQNHDTHIISNSSSNNYYEGQKNNNPKLLLYKTNEKKNNNLFYFANEDTEQNQNPTKSQKYGQMFNKMSNNSIMNGTKSNTKKNKNIINNKNNNNNTNNNISNNTNTNNKTNNNMNKNNQNNNLIKNNLFNNNNNKNNELPKRYSVINFVPKVDKSKNLFVFKGNLDRKEEKDYRNNRVRNHNRYDRNRNDSSKSIKRMIIAKFDINNLKNINANEIKIVSQKKMELPISSICYFNKCTLYKEKRLKLPISTICHFNKMTVFTEEKLKMPISEICYFNKSFIVKEIKIRQNIVNDFYFCTKTKKINEKKEKSLIIENCIEFDFIKTITKKLNFTSKKASNLKIKNLDNSKSKSKSKSKNKNEKVVNTPKIFKYQPKSKKKNKESEAKFLEYKKRLNDRLKNYKTVKHEDNMKKIHKHEKEKKEKEREEKISKSRKNINKSVSIKKEPHIFNFNPKQRVQRFIVSKTEHENNISRKENKDKYINSTISYNRTSANNNKNYFKYSFYSLFDINSRYNNDYSGNEEKSKSKKKILKRFIENGQNNNNKSKKTNKNNIENIEKEENNEKEKEKEKYDKNNNNNFIMPKINDNINKENKKSKTIINTKSSRMLIKKINSSNFKNRNINKSLIKITKKQNNTNDNYTDWLRAQKKNDINIYKNDLPELSEHKNIEHKNECNHIKYDKHFGNENNCPKCQSMDIKINYLKEKKNEAIPKINSHQVNNSLNKTIEDYQRENIIIPFKYFGKLYLKNYNNYKNTSKRFLTKLQRNNSVIQIKKINISKYSGQLLKNYRTNLLAIKEYFNIK